MKLDLSKNKLRQLPVDFGRLVNLQHLDLLNNRLVTLPVSFAQLKVTIPDPVFHSQVWQRAWELRERGCERSQQNTTLLSQPQVALSITGTQRAAHFVPL